MDNGAGKFMPMTETGFYILLALRRELHGYGIIQGVLEMTSGRLHLGPGTVYGTLSKLEKAGLIEMVREEDRRKVYIQTALGSSLIDLETERLKEMLSAAGSV